MWSLILALGIASAASVAAPSAAGSSYLPPAIVEPVQAPIAAVDSTEIPIDARVELLERRLAISEQHTDNLEEFISHGFGLTGILLTLLGIVFPVAAYITSILPARQAAAESRRVLDTLDARFLEMLNRHEANRIEEAVQQLETDQDLYSQELALSYLRVNPHFPFSSQQIARLCDVARGSHGTLRIALLSFLAGRRDAAISDLMSSVIKGSNAQGELGFAVKQCGVDPSPRLKAELKGVLATDGGREMLSSVLLSAVLYAKAIALDIVADRDLLEKFTRYEVAVALTRARRAAERNKMWSIFEASPWFERIKGRHVLLTRLSDKTHAEVPRDQADHIIVMTDGTVDRQSFKQQQGFEELAAEAAGIVE